MSPTGKEIINAFRKEGYFLLDLGESNLLQFRKLCEEFYEKDLDTRLQVLACKESGILGYYPSHIESEKAASPGKINHFHSERQRGYSSFDYVGEDSQLLSNSPLFKMNLWLDDNFRNKALSNYILLKEIGISILNSICQELLEP